MVYNWNKGRLLDWFVKVRFYLIDGVIKDGGFYLVFFVGIR